MNIQIWLDVLGDIFVHEFPDYVVPLLTKGTVITIGRDDIPQRFIPQRFGSSKLDHIDFTIDSVEYNTKRKLVTICGEGTFKDDDDNEIDA